MNNKSKVSYRLSKTEFWMLIILVAVVLLAVSVIYLISPAMDALSLSAQDYEMQRARLELLKQDNEKLPEYLAQEAEADAQLLLLSERMPAYYSQEITLDTFDNLAFKNGLTLMSVSFEGVKTDTRAAFLSQLRHDAKASEADSAAANAGDMVRYETIELGFSGTYNALYGFIGDLAGETRAVFSRELVLTRAKEGAVTGGLTLLVLSEAAVEGGDYPGYDYAAAPATGKTDPFISFPGYFEGDAAEPAGSEVELDPDFYITLNTYDDNDVKVRMGRYGSAAGELESAANKVLTASVTFEEKDGKITYSYELDGKKYEGSTAASERHPTQIVFAVLSHARKDAKDKVGVTLSVVNKTGLTVIMDVRGDDAASPRFKLGTTQGAVQVGK